MCCISWIYFANLHNGPCAVVTRQSKTMYKRPLHSVVFLLIPLLSHILCSTDVLVLEVLAFTITIIFTPVKNLFKLRLREREYVALDAQLAPIPPSIHGT